MTKKELGENAAINLLIEKGYTILERNYRIKHLEVYTLHKRMKPLLLLR